MPNGKEAGYQQVIVDGFDGGDKQGGLDFGGQGQGGQQIFMFGLQGDEVGVVGF